MGSLWRSNRGSYGAVRSSHGRRAVVVRSFLLRSCRPWYKPTSGILEAKCRARQGRSGRRNREDHEIRKRRKETNNKALALMHLPVESGGGRRVSVLDRTVRGAVVWCCRGVCGAAVFADRVVWSGASDEWFRIARSFQTVPAVPVTGFRILHELQ